MSSGTRSTRVGFTLLEMIVATSIFAVVLGLFVMIVHSAQGNYSASSAAMDLETNGSRTLRRIVDAVRASDLPSLTALPSPPFSATQFDYQVTEGYQDKQTAWSDPRSIRLDPATDRVMWTENLGLADERQAEWCDGVADYLEGETFNGLDDNGNGLIDERGLAFAREGNRLSIHLTLEELGPNGNLQQRTWTTRLNCRN